MSEIIFLIEDDLEGGYNAKALNYSIFSSGNNVQELKENIKDAVLCHFEENEVPKIIRLHFVRDEILAIA